MVSSSVIFLANVKSNSESLGMKDRQVKSDFKKMRWQWKLQWGWQKKEKKNEGTKRRYVSWNDDDSDKDEKKN